MLGRISLVLTLIVTASAPRYALGQPGPRDPAPAPIVEVDDGFSAHVSVERQERARKLHRAGNQHLGQADFEPALAIFQSALAEWDHPAIRFNMTVALIRLNRMVEAYENLVASMKYGPGPLGPQAYAQAVNYKALLEASVAELVVLCAEPGARVTLDGKYLFTGPGQIELWVRVGEHQVVAQKPNRQTVSESLQVEAMKQNRIEIGRSEWPELPPDTVVVQRWDTWKPWAVTGLGAAIALAGGPLQLLAQSNMDEFDQIVALECSDAQTCDESVLGANIRLYNRARLQNRMAVSAFAVGGAVLAVGLTLVFLNRPQSKEVPRLVVVPEVGEQRAVLWGRVSF